MNKLTVIGTGHTEGGACNSVELIKIIDKIAPSVIFCEASPEIFPKLLEATDRFNTPEIKTFRTIIANQSIDIIPVDLSNDPFDRRLEAMLELFSKMIKEYFYATEIQVGETHRLGFPYLNSQDSDQIHKDKATMERIFVAKSKDVQLSKTHKDWLKWNDDRENHWIEMIHAHFQSTKFLNAVFVVGSAHRIRLIEKINNFENASELILDWDFYPYK